MGYNLHITRKENWYDKQEPKDITLEEWKDYIKSDSEMRMDNFAETTTTDGTNQTLRTEREGIAVWVKKHSEKDGGGWIYYDDGNIVVKSPDKEMIEKIIQIAKELDAAVVGDEGEEYTEEYLKTIFDENGNYL